MSTVLKGIIRNGRVVVNESMDWPDRTEVVVAPEVSGASEKV